MHFWKLWYLLNQCFHFFWIYHFWGQGIQLKYFSIGQICETRHVCIFDNNKGRTIRYLGGGVEFLLLANFFLPPRENNLFFGNQCPTIFFYVLSKNFFVVCFPYYVGNHIFSGQHIFHKFQTIFFFCPHFQQTFFFWLSWRQTIFFNFFLAPPPPPPGYQMVRP